MEKRVETAALAGRPIIHLNNLPNGMTLESEALSQLSSEGIVAIRKLGKHEEGRCDCRATTVFVNGNNISIAADLVPRTPVCRLVTGLEQPETRSFKTDPIKVVRGDRGGYLAAVFTIVRAFLAAGSPRPDKINVIAGYEGWSRYVQQPLIWLGMDDPFGNLDETRALDPTEGELQRLFDVLVKYRAELGDSFTVSKCLELAEEKMTDPAGGSRYRRPDLRDLMTSNGRIDTQAFGYLLRRHRDRVRNGLKIVAETGGRVARYRLIGATSEPPSEPPELF
jgi:putative DNA primase/helicase